MIEKTVWMTYREYLPIELVQSEEEGKNIETYRKEAEFIFDDKNWSDTMEDFRRREELAWKLLDRIEKEPVRADYPYQEPDDWDAIQTLTGKQEPKGKLPSEDVLRDKIYGAWLGRCIGCLLGQPIEGWKRERIVGFLKATDNYPVKRFMSSDVSQEIIDKYQVSNNGENAFCDTVTHWINNVTDMPEDDDTNYTAIGLKILEIHGKSFTSSQMAQLWIESLPMGHVSTSERVAYRNIGNLIETPRSGWWKNPYREWIGAQIRADIFGYVSPGKPLEASRMAWTDARISHTKNGIYGEMYIAAMIAAAFLENDMVDVVEAGLAQIPATSRLHQEIRLIVDAYQKGMTAEDAIIQLHQKYDEGDSHAWCHTITNAAAVTICLLYSAEDFEYALHLAMECGYDTDCNGATVGSLMGIRAGEAGIPQNWKAGLTGNLRTGVSGFHRITVKELAERTWKAAEID